VARIRRNPILVSAISLAGILMIAVAVYAAYLASVAGALPWQEDPTRIPVTPFGEIPGFTAPTPLPTATAEP
jgi:hypothetical protein